MFNFYLFETLIPFIFKFGMTSKSVQERLNQYKGISKPKQLIGYFECKDGFLMESNFKNFLNKKNIKFTPEYGDEYFYFEGGINILFFEFSGCDLKLIDTTRLQPKQKYDKATSQSIVRTEINEMLGITENTIGWKIIGKDLDNVLAEIMKQDKRYSTLLKVKPAKRKTNEYNRAKGLQILNKYLRACGMNQVIRVKKIVRRQKNKKRINCHELYEYSFMNNLKI